MAKIYETHADAERDQLVDQLKDVNHSASKNFDSAIIGALIATGSHTAEELNKVSASLGKARFSGLASTFNNILLWAGAISGGLGLIGFFSDRSKAAHISGHLHELGPQTIVHPPSTAENICDEPHARKHCDRLQQEIASSTGRTL